MEHHVARNYASSKVGNRQPISSCSFVEWMAYCLKAKGVKFISGWRPSFNRLIIPLFPSFQKNETTKKSTNLRLQSLIFPSWTEGNYSKAGRQLLSLPPKLVGGGAFITGWCSLCLTIQNASWSHWGERFLMCVHWFYSPHPVLFSLHGDFPQAINLSCRIHLKTWGKAIETLTQCAGCASSFLPLLLLSHEQSILLHFVLS